MVDVGPPINTGEHVDLGPYTPETMIADFAKLADLQRQAKQLESRSDGFVLELVSRGQNLLEKYAVLSAEDINRIPEEELQGLGSLGLSELLAVKVGGTASLESAKFGNSIARRLGRHHYGQLATFAVINPGSSSGSPIHTLTRDLNSHIYEESSGPDEVTGKMTDLYLVNNLSLGIKPSIRTRFRHLGLYEYSAKLVNGASQPLVTVDF